MNDNRSSVRNDEMEVNLADLFVYVISKWRTVLIWALVFAVLLGGCMGLSSLRKLHDPEYIAQVEESNKHNMNSYESSKAQLENRMRTITEEINKQTEYQENSFLYAIDPFNTYVMETSYYVDTGYEILPENMFQNPNYSIPVISAYQTTLQNISIEEILCALEGRDFQVEYDKRNSFLKVSFDQNDTAIGSNGILRIRAIGSSSEQVEAIMAAVEKTINENKALIESSIHEHSITKIASTEYQTVFQDLIGLHEPHSETMTELTAAMSETLDEYNKLKEPNLVDLNSDRPVKDSLLYAIIGAIVGAVVGLLVTCFSFVSKSPLADAKDAENRYNKPVFGVIVSPGKGTGLDYIISGKRGLPKDADWDAALSLSAANIRMLAGDCKKISLLGTVDPERINELCRELEPSVPGLELSAGGNPLRSADAVKALFSCDAVILVEEIAKSRHTDLCREEEQIVRSGKELLGFLLVGSSGKPA